MSFRKTVSWIFFPLTMWYSIGVRFRNFLFNTGIKKQVAPQVTTIGVGNICAGGAGKTPHAEYLLKMVADQYRTVLLSRGYKRKSRGFQIDDGHHDANVLGDEPAMVAQKHPAVTVAVCEKRLEGIDRLLQMKEPPQVIILDDSYQHRYVKPTVNILLTEYDNPFFKDRIMPFGNLREHRSARRRANIIIVTKSPEKLNPIEKHTIIEDLKLQPYQKVFFSYIHYCEPMPLMGGHPLPLNTLDSVLLLTGIAHPESMCQYVQSQCQIEPMRYADHHRYTASDLKHIRKSFDQLKGDRKVILTTEKDAVRLRELVGDSAMEGLPIYVLPIEVRIHQTDEYNFDKTIINSIKENVMFLNRMQNASFDW